MTTKATRNYVTVTSGLRGFFAVIVSVDEDGFEEPWITSPLSFDTYDRAADDARRWAEGEGLALRLRPGFSS